MLHPAYLAAAIIALGYPCAAKACVCSGGGPAAAAARASAVFVGRAVAVEPERPGSPGGARHVRFIVTRPVKAAALGDTVTVADYAGTSCGVGFVRGRAYLVYTEPGPGGRPATDVCAGTRPLACAARDLRALGVRSPAGAGDCAPPAGRVRPAPSSPGA